MIIFTEFSDALEEAAWCADSERKTYVIHALQNGFAVSKKQVGRRRYRGLEVGFKRKYTRDKVCKASYKTY
jgi:hypothetical protein